MYVALVGLVCGCVTRCMRLMRLGASADLSLRSETTADVDVAAAAAAAAAAAPWLQLCHCIVSAVQALRRLNREYCVSESASAISQGVRASSGRCLFLYWMLDLVANL